MSGQDQYEKVSLEMLLKEVAADDLIEEDVREQARLRLKRLGKKQAKK